jgi:hypothetical protein
MLATKPKERAKLVSAGFAYAEVEAAISRVLGVDAEAQITWVRGRIQHLRRLGLTPPADRGPVDYTFEWAARWLLALRLERVGLSPVAIVKFFNDNWERKAGHKFPVTPLREVIEDARAQIEKARKANKPYDDDDPWLVIRFDDLMPGAFPKIGRVRPYRKRNPKQDNAKGFFDRSRTDGVDEVTIPLTEVLRLLETELNR